MKGILFKPDMIKAIVDGRKTQTRRLSGLKEINREPDRWELLGAPSDVLLYFRFVHINGKVMDIRPRYQVGEVVYLKEGIHRFSIEYASYSLDSTPVMCLLTASRFLWRWQRDTLSPMFLPQEAARHHIQITGVGLGRLREITEADVIAEGIEDIGAGDLRGMYAVLWDSINPKFPWDSNPWCWRYEFKKVEG